MTAVVLYFQVHQPYRLRRYSIFDDDPFYFDNDANERICRKVAEKCYRPATRALLDLVKRHGGGFRVSFSITGVVLDQLRAWAPDVIDLFAELVETGCCEMLGETYHHALAFLYSREEFREQVDLHTEAVRGLFGVTPRVFRNTELIYNNELAHFVAGLTDEGGSPRFDGMLAEGVDTVLGIRSPNHVYRPPTVPETPARERAFALLLKNYRLSDDIAFRFSNRDWSEWPLSAEKFASWIDAINGHGRVCNLFMDYETLGEHQWAETGIFEFLGSLPGAVLSAGGGRNTFLTPSQALERYEPVGEYDAPHMTSWADTERDLSAWIGNAMQAGALRELYKLEKPIKDALRAAVREGDGARARELAYVLGDWRNLTTSDHAYYMCTKFFADGDVHTYFNPYDSPYDSYINFQNVMDNLRTRLHRWAPEASAASHAGG